MHISIDIETLAPTDKAQIIQISAVAFELNGAVCEPHELLQFEDRWLNIYLKDYEGDRDPKTLAWWSEPEQADGKREAMTTLAAFCELWLGKRGKLWALPPTFDLRILRGFYGAFRVPWHYTQEFDLRTLLWMAEKVPGVKAPSFEGKGLVKHFALHDAARQATLAQVAYRALIMSGNARAEQSPAAAS
jgi:hypothetical protein